METDPEAGLGITGHTRDPMAANDSPSDEHAAKRVDTKTTPAALQPTNDSPAISPSMLVLLRRSPCRRNKFNMSKLLHLRCKSLRAKEPWPMATPNSPKKHFSILMTVSPMSPSMSGLRIGFCQTPSIALTRKQLQVWWTSSPLNRKYHRASLW